MKRLTVRVSMGFSRIPLLAFLLVTPVFARRKHAILPIEPGLFLAGRIAAVSPVMWPHFTSRFGSGRPVLTDRPAVQGGTAVIGSVHDFGVTVPVPLKERASVVDTLQTTADLLFIGET
jgi:hypothetical protein